MGALSAARLLAAGSVWRVTTVGAAGRALISAVSSPDPDDRALAGILLTRAGDRSVPLIGEALSAGADPSDLVNVLASIGTDAARATLENAAGSGRPDVATAAREALRSLEEQRRGSE
jgi:hypothetical protein